MKPDIIVRTFRHLLPLMVCAATLALGGVAGAQTITTFAGGGTLTGDGVPATDALLNVPEGIAIDRNGNVYVAEGTLSVRRIDGTTGIITTVAGNGIAGYCVREGGIGVGGTYDGAACGDGGPATSASLSIIFSIAVDRAGNLYIADTVNHVIRRVDAATGIITAVAGGGVTGLDAEPRFEGDGGPALDAALYFPRAVAVDAAGNLYIADTFNGRLRKVDAVTGIIGTIAGSLGAFLANGGSGGDGGPALLASFQSLERVAVDAFGNVYVADGTDAGALIRRIDAATGIITRVAGGGTGAGESGLAVDADLGYLADIALDAAGNLYVAGAFRVWRVDAAGNISRFAGAGDINSGSTGDGGPAILATFGFLGGIEAAGNGDVYLTDHGGRVRKITAPVVIPPPDVIIDDTTSQSVLDGLVNPPACVLVVGTNRTTLVMPNLMSIGGCLTITNNSELTDVDLATGGGIGGSVTISDNPSAADVDLATGGGIGGSVTISDNPSAANVGIDVGESIIGDVTVTNNDAATSIDVGITTSVGGSVTITDNDGAAAISLDIGSGVGGTVTITDNDGAAAVSLDVGSGVGGSVTITDNGDAAVTIDTPSVGGDLTVSARSQLDLNLSNTTVDGNVRISTGGTTTVSGQTGGGTTTVTLANGPATMTVALPAGTFTNRVVFTVNAVSGSALTASAGTDPASVPVLVTPLSAYQFAFAIPTLNQDATLTFDIAVAALDAAGQAALLSALASNTATLAVRGDAPGSVFQTFAVCAGQAPTVGGCANVVPLDATGVVIPAGDPTVPTTVRFTGVTGSFSTYAVVIVSQDTTAPVISSVPATLVAEATSAAGAAVTYALPTALDDRDGAVAVTCAPVSGTTFSQGTSTVTCTATDASGNSSSATFTVTVQDTTPPALACPASLTGTAASASGAVVSYPAATVTDTVDLAPVVTYVPASGTLFPVGTTTVTVTATDASGNVATCSFTVTIDPPPALGADLSLTHTVAPNPVTLGRPVTYTLTIRNNGPSPATDVGIVHTVLGFARFVSATASEGQCAGLGSLVSCSLGTLASGATTTVTIVVTPRLRGHLTSTAAVWSVVPDPHLANNWTVVTTQVR